MSRKLFTRFTIGFVCLITLLTFTIVPGADAQDKITGPWLWMIAPTAPGQGGDTSINVDSLSAASGDVVTERYVAARGATAGDSVGNLAWTLGTIAATGSNNLGTLVNNIGFGTGDINHHSAYALITLESATAQPGVTMRAGSDDAIKIWLNGAVVHTNPVNRWSNGFQDTFTVDLKAGDNLLLVKVSERAGEWSMFVGIDAAVNAVYKPAVIVFTPDARLRSRINSSLNKGINDPITVAEMASLTTLDAVAGIRDLTGLEYAINLTGLNLSQNGRLTDISPLAQLTKLEELDLTSCTTLSNISPLSGVSSLTVLRLTETAVSDLSPLSGLSNLAVLRLTETAVSDLSPLLGLTSLTNLWVGDTPQLNATSINEHLPLLKSQGVNIHGRVVPTAPNEPPTFTSAATFTVPEHITEVGVVTATDPDPADSVTYALTGGNDRLNFTIDANTGALTLNIELDFEIYFGAPGANIFAIEVTATSGTGDRERTRTQSITITVTDVDEPPDAPAAPTMTGETANNLFVSWLAPTNTGPPITDYDVQYSDDGGTTFTDAGYDGVQRAVMLRNLTDDTRYEVQVRATNAEGTGDWSPSGTAETLLGNRPPIFTSASSFEIPENTIAVGTVTATDANAEDTVTYAISEGGDSTAFTIHADTGALTFNTAPNFEAPASAEGTNTYAIEVKATSGIGYR